MELHVLNSPLHLITELMANVPMLDKDESARVSQPELVKLTDKGDTLWHEEVFFDTNALDVHAYFCQVQPYLQCYYPYDTGPGAGPSHTISVHLL